MWFGTVDGLNRFDGYSIKIFNTEKNNPNSLSNNTVHSLSEDKFGRIWIGTDDGLNMYDPGTESILQVIPSSSTTQKLNIHSLLIYENHLFLGTGNGLFRIKLKKKYNQSEDLAPQLIIIDSDDQDSNISIINLKECKQGGFWMQSSSIVNQIVVEPHNNKAIIIDTVIQGSTYNFFDLVEDNSNNLWISCSRNGLIRYNLTTEKMDVFQPTSSNNGPSSLKCSEISIDNKGNLWFGTLDKGVNFITCEQLNKSKIQFEHIQHNPYDPSSLNSNLIRTLYVTKDDLLWVGTIGAGINCFDSDQKKFNHIKINTATDNGSSFIRAINIDNNDNIWAGTHSNGLYQINRYSNKITKLGLENKTVFYITHYEKDKYFICCDDGLYLIQKKSKNTIKILNHTLTNASFYIIKGEEGYYWLASFRGVFRLKIVNNKIVIDKNYPLKTYNSNSPQNCRVLFLDKKNNELLVGTEGGGLHILSLNNKQEVIKVKKHKNNPSLENSISNNYIRSIVQDDKGTFWVGTYEGLNKMVKSHNSNDVSFKTYTRKDGLPNNMINSIVEDNAGYLWVGTNNGLSKFNPINGQFINYFETDGLQSNEFSEHAVCKSKTGEIMIGGINGITTFYPKKITKSERQPQTTITDFFLNDIRVNPNQKVGKNIPLKKGITISDTITLLPKQNNIGFDFSSMLYPNAKNIKYAFMLDGFDKNWQYTEYSKTHANYTNLDYGKFTFKVKSTNGDGIWEKQPRELYINIKTPFQYTWYAYALYLIVIALTLVYFSYYSIIRYTTKNKLLLDIEHNRKIQSLNKLRTQFFINISHDLRTPLTLIKGPLENILLEKNIDKDTKGKLILIKRNVKRLNFLIEQLLDVRRAESGKLVAQLHERDIVHFTKKEIAHFSYAIHKKGLTYNVNCSSKKLIIGFDADMLSKVYFNIISNAVKYTDRGEINILIKQEHKQDDILLRNSKYESFVKVEVSDSGKGISQERLSKVFERFYQENTTKEKGYGIGLSHTYQLIEAHDGYIVAESKEKYGTTICFYIPDTTSSLSPNLKITSSEDDIFREEKDDVLIEKSQPHNDSAKTILIVEDNADMRSYIKSELINNYNIMEAEDGVIGIKIAKNHDIDLIISDVMMPNMDGITYCNYIKTNIKTSHIPVILLTAKTDKQSKYKGIETGADDYISKPFEMQYLVLRIKNLLHSREQLRKVFQNKDTFLEPSSVTVNSIDEEFLKTLMEAVEEGIPDVDFNITSLEEKLSMSHSNFYRKVKSLTGLSGKEILNEMRMKRAKQILIENKNIRVDEVAYMVGFSNPKYFGKIFKEKFGVSPTEMKSKNNSKNN
nr:two-component regulator propeller domain-containing protein [Lutibacter agarilyticus]